MSDDLVKRLRNTPNWMREEYAHYKDGLKVFDRAPFESAYALEAQAAEITRLRAELATARREGMEEAAQIAEECYRQNGPLSQRGFPERYRAGLAAGAQAIAAAIRAAAGEVK